MQMLKRRFFAMRNGIVADCMRKAGAPYRIVFGLTLPQIREIAADFGPDAEMARELWRNVSTRESLLIAPMLMPADAMTAGEAARWIETAPSAEAIDILCLKLLRAQPYAAELAAELFKSDRPLTRYASLRLSMNLLPADIDGAEQRARAESGQKNSATFAVARQILDEIEFLKEC